MEHSMQCHLALENHPSMGVHKVGTRWDASLTLIEVRVKQPHLSTNYKLTSWVNKTSPGCKLMFLIFFPGSIHFSNLNAPSHSRHFAQVQASGYSPALQRKKNSSILSNSSRSLGWMTEPAVPSAAAVFKDRDFTASHEATFQHNRQPHSILVRPDSQKNNVDKVMSVWWFERIWSVVLTVHHT